VQTWQTVAVGTAVAVLLPAVGIRVVQPHERGVVSRFGRLLPGVREPVGQVACGCSTR
jgi:regulator of protease activity HflC (stomatin/prohibitin superfamily)